MALAGKSCLWVPTTGGDATAYSVDGIHQQPVENFIAPVFQTARFCAMVWEAPLIVQGAHKISDGELAASAAAFRARLIDWAAAREPTIENHD